TITPDAGDNFEPFSHTIEQQDPLAAHPPYAPDFYRAIGRMTLQWGHVERVLNVALFLTRTMESSKAHKGPALINFRRKVRAVEAAIEDGRMLGDGGWDELFQSTLELALNVAGERHDIAHGLEIGFRAGPPPRIQFLHQELEPEGIKDRIA